MKCVTVSVTDQSEPAHDLNRENKPPAMLHRTGNRRKHIAKNLRVDASQMATAVSAAVPPSASSKSNQTATVRQMTVFLLCGADTGFVLAVDKWIQREDAGSGSRRDYHPRKWCHFWRVDDQQVSQDKVDLYILVWF